MTSTEIQLWDVCVTSSGVRDGWPLLCDEEKARADRFLVDDARSAFVVARSTLRTLAGQYLQVAPESLVFEKGPQGKPFLEGSWLHFNVSHSAARIVLGFARDLPLGVDVERVRTVGAMWAIAEKWFAPEEVADLQACEHQADPVAAFFRCWTCKEAYVKAVGGGLSISLKGFRVTVRATDEPAILLPGWSLHCWSPAPGFAAALAFEGKRDIVMRCFADGGEANARTSCGT